jgi:hypothetical protein
MELPQNSQINADKFCANLRNLRDNKSNFYFTGYGTTMSSQYSQR